MYRNDPRKNLAKGAKTGTIGGIGAAIASIIVGLIVNNNPDLAPEAGKWLEPGIAALVTGLVGGVLNFVKHRRGA
jgi:hypothetical protein